MTSPKVRLAVLRRKTSKNGNEYFTGWLPGCNLLLFRSKDDDDQYGEAWVPLAAERDGTQKRQQQPARDDRARQADAAQVAAAKRDARRQRPATRPAGGGGEPFPDDRLDDLYPADDPGPAA